MPLRVVRLGGRISLVLMCLGDTASYIVVSNMVCRAAEMSPQKVRYCYDSLDAEIVLQYLTTSPRFNTLLPRRALHKIDTSPFHTMVLSEAFVLVDINSTAET